jgi:carboxypeptidase Taq
MMPMVEPKLAELKTRLAEVNDLHSAAAVLGWDQTTYMPPGGAEARGRQISTLERLAHEKFTDPAIGQLLAHLEPYEKSVSYDSDDAALIRVTRRDYERAVKVPPAFVAKFSAHTAATYDAWVKARPANDFAAIRPFLERTLEYSRELANYFPGYNHIADPLIDFADYGMKAATVSALFAELKKQLVPIVQAITAQPLVDDACLHRHFPEAQQLAFGAEVVKRLGYDFERGRQDKTRHPFQTTFSLGDVRITTRVKEDDLGDALFSTIHEAGHAMYEQGIRSELEAKPLAHGT